jgi:hypothetical protein
VLVSQQCFNVLFIFYVYLKIIWRNRFIKQKVVNTPSIKFQINEKIKLKWSEVKVYKEIEN